MKKLLTILALTLTACSPHSPSNQSNMTDTTPKEKPENLQIATFAGGCFWCMEPAFEALEGTHEVVVGYVGDTEENATYKLVSSGKTKHREAVQVTFDPEKVDYPTLLETFWQQIDPNDDGGQFADRGFQYTTAIYFHDENQAKLAQKSIDDLAASGKFEQPIATILKKYSTFFLAEDYHQDFYKKSSAHYEAYKQGSGRADFIQENWAKEAALQNSR